MLKRLDITGWLNELDQSASTAAPTAENQLFAWLYEDMQRLARNYMRKENPGHTLSATALTHEAWFRMSEQTRTQWASRSHFLAVSSMVMRRILLHHAMAKRTEKRNVALVSMTLAEYEVSDAPAPDVVAVHESLLAFETVDVRAAKVVELRFFGGMENTEIAEALGISVATVKREWSLARAWLLRDLQRTQKPL